MRNPQKRERISRRFNYTPIRNSFLCILIDAGYNGEDIRRLLQLLDKAYKRAKGPSYKTDNDLERIGSDESNNFPRRF